MSDIVDAEGKAYKAVADLQHAVDLFDIAGILAAYRFVEQDDFNWSDVDSEYYNIWRRLVVEGDGRIHDSEMVDGVVVAPHYRFITTKRDK